VSLVPALYARFRLLAYELGKFGAVGVLAFLVTDAGTNLLHFQAGQGPLTANVVATVVAMAVSYAGNRYWTFRDRQRTGVRREGTLFFLLNGVGLAIQLACLGFATYLLGLHGKLSYNVALVAGIAMATLFRYWSYKQWVWRAVPATPTEWAPYAPAQHALAPHALAPHALALPNPGPLRPVGLAPAGGQAPAGHL
jgi:putative flippase GtrA